jgi:hypothetical protein
MPARTLSQTREPEETASRDSTQRWLAVSEPLAVDDDPDWDEVQIRPWRRAPQESRQKRYSGFSQSNRCPSSQADR